MGRRGHPPYPDILTPRQWEVLDLLRRGLSDQQIADALDLTLAGAKYHVSEILTKLGVATREEAAAWELPKARSSWWRRALALSLAVKAVGTVIIVAAIVGIAVLAWGAAHGGTGDTAPLAVFDELPLPTPITAPTLTRDQALVKLGSKFELGDVQVLESLQASTMDDILRAYSSQEASGTHPDTAWLVRIRSFADDLMNTSGGPNRRPGDPTPLTACRELSFIWVDHESQGPGSGNIAGTSSTGPPLPDNDCSAAPSSDLALLVAGSALQQYIVHQTPDSVTTQQTTAAAAVQQMEGSQIAASFDASGERTIRFG